MKGQNIAIRSDLLNRYASLDRRIKNLLDGVTPMRFYIGAYGLNTSWIKLTPMKGWHTVGGSHIYARIRSDVIYLHTEGEGGVAPVSSTDWPTTPALQLPGKPHVFWPTYRVKTYCLTKVGGDCEMLVKPNGLIFFEKPTEGRTLVPGSASWPRG